MNVVDHGKTIQEAVAAGRFHHQWLPDRIVHEEGAFSEETIAKLKEFGHSLMSVKPIGDAQGVVIDPETGLLMAGPDPRRIGAAVGY
jgi:gamma-glutamyltranspeptidase/glutathione hydrolase